MDSNLSARKTKSALRSSAMISLQILLVLVMLWVTFTLIGEAWSIVWPLVVALLLTTLTWPPVRFLRRHRWPPALAASVVTVLFLLIAAGTLFGIVAPVASESPQLAEGIANGIQTVRDWAAGPPLNIGDAEVTTATNAAVDRIQSSVGSIATATLTGVGTVVDGLVTTILALFLMFFFLKDGPRFLPWLSQQLPGRLSRDVPVVFARSWETLGAFVRSQAFIGLLDAVAIGIGLWIVGVPLVLPLAVLTFVAAFVPIVGALFAGFVAVLIALVSNGWTDALIVLGIIVAVQQLEGNIFQPIVQSRGLGLHAGVVLLAVTLGSGLYGIVGALLAVPVAALVAVFWNYLREQLTHEPPPDRDPVDERVEEVLQDPEANARPEPA